MPSSSLIFSISSGVGSIALIQAPAAVPGRRHVLSQREREVLCHVAAGQTDKEIAAVLCIGERTVEWHLANAFNKLGVSTRAAAVAAALQQQLL